MDKERNWTEEMDRKFREVKRQLDDLKDYFEKNMEDIECRT